MKTPLNRRPIGPLPSGTLMMLLTDIEGSTRLWENHPKAMEAAVPRHREIAHQTVDRFRGYRPPDQGEVVLSKARSSSWVWISDSHTGGDGSFAVGSAPPGSIPPWREASPTEIQQGLQSGALKRT